MIFRNSGLEPRLGSRSKPSSVVSIDIDLKKRRRINPFLFRDRIFDATQFRWCNETTFFGCFLVLLLVALIIKNITLDSPIMGSDEYAYFAQAREFPNIASILAYDQWIQQTNNVLYLWFGHFLWLNVENPDLVMRVAQACMYILIVPLAFGICRHFLGRLNSAIVSAVACCGAMSCYSAYFMPETLYELLFFMLARVTVAVLPQRPVLGATVCAFLVALLLLTKPNGLAIVFAVGLTLLAGVVLPSLFFHSRSRWFAAFSVFCLATYVSMVVVNDTLTGHLQLSPLLFVGHFYLEYFPDSRVVPSWSDLYPVLLGNGIALIMLAGIPIVCIGCGSWCVWRRSHESDLPKDGHIQRARFAILTVFALSALLLSVMMTVRFTLDNGGDEIWRIYGRYYSFAIVLCVVAMGASETIWNDGSSMSVPISMVFRGTAIFGILVLLVIEFWWRMRFAIEPYDFPEIFAFGVSDGLGSGPLAGKMLFGGVVVVIGCVCLIGILVRPDWTVASFLTFLAVLDIASLTQVSVWQYGNNHNFAAFSQPGTAIRMLLSKPELDRGIIIADQPFQQISYTLFNLRSRSQVFILPQNSVVSMSLIDSNVDWVLLVGPYVNHLPGRVIIRGDELELIGLHPIAPFLP